jgi:hypothetical protein
MASGAGVANAAYDASASVAAGGGVSEDEGNEDDIADPFMHGIWKR